MTTHPSPRALIRSNGALSLSSRALSPSKSTRGLLIGAVLVGVGLTAGCDQSSATGPAPSTAPAGPAPTSPAPTSSTPTSSAPAGPSSRPTGSPIQPVPAGVGGLDVRYLDENGQVKTLRVEDFPR